MGLSPNQVWHRTFNPAMRKHIQGSNPCGPTKKWHCSINKILEENFMPIARSTQFVIPHLAVYSGKSLNVNGQDGRPEEMTFSSDGLKMFMLGRQTGSAATYQYTLSSPYDLTGAVYSNKTFVVETQAPDPQGFDFSADGLKLFVLNYDGNLYQYTLTTAFDIGSGVSYSGKNFSATQTSNAHDIAFNSTGLKLFIVSATPGNTVFEYTLSSAFDLTGMSYSGNSFTNTINNPTSISFDSTGLKMIISSVLGLNSGVYLYDLVTPFVITSGVTLNRRFVNVSSQENQPNGMAINPTFSKLFVVGGNTDSSYQYTVVQ